MKLPYFHAGTLTALKWFAVVLMVLDHADWLVFGSQLGVHATVGRVVFPIFGFVIAYNLARPSVGVEAYRRTALRCLVIGLIASVAYVPLAGLLPLNIMFTLSLFAGALWLGQGRGLPYVFAGLLLFGWFVDYGWPGLAFCFAVWGAYRSDSRWIYAALACVASLWIVNGSQWALLAVPLIALASMVRVDLPRSQMAFYAVYPAHLAALALLATSGVRPFAGSLV